jgi:UDP-glucose 4-epimerase
MQIAVTGAGGFIGRHLVTHLAACGHAVRALSRADAPDSVTAVEVDGTRSSAPVVRPWAEALAGIEAVAHLAGQSNLERSGHNSQLTAFDRYYQANVALTERLLQACDRSTLRCLVYASTRVVYAGSLGRPAREDDPPQPDGLYGLSKLTAEHVIRVYGTQHGFTSVILRLNQVVGPGDKGRGILPAFIDQAVASRPLKVNGEGAAIRSFVDIRDVVCAFQRALERGSRGFALFNISGADYRVSELAHAVARSCGAQAGVQFVPCEAEDRSTFAMDCTRAREHLGWVPVHTLEDTIRYRADAGP